MYFWKHPDCLTHSRRKWELRKEQYGDALGHYFRLGKNLNQRDTIAVRRMVGGYLKLMYPNGEFTKEEVFR